ncbi:MAG: hypothetical protein L3J10_02345 [Sulfurimonas sp.]|nr:hypothetical protein [Sulfurimonas sp.]
MKRIISSLVIALVFLVGCSSPSEAVKESDYILVVGKSLDNITLNDQFEKSHEIDENTKKIIVAFSKDMAHLCNDYFDTQTQTYLSDNNTQFIADVSSAPSLIRSLFIMPGLKDFKHTVLLLEDETIASAYKASLSTEKIIVVYVDNKSIIDIKTINTELELKETIEAF